MARKPEMELVWYGLVVELLVISYLLLVISY